MGTIVLGLIAGSIYALIAAGITLVYKSSRVLNFAQAEIGTLTLYATYYLTVRAHQPWIVGALASVAGAALIGLLFERLVIRRMLTAPRMTVTVATIGLFSFLLAVELAIWAGTIFLLPAPIQHGGTTISGVYVNSSQWLAFGVVAVIAAGLTLFLRYTDFGLAVQASADDPVASQLMGAPRGAISAFTWGTAGALSAIAALFIEPTVGALAPGGFSGLFIGGLTGALLGGLTSLPGAFAGGMLVGLAEAEVTAHIATDAGVPATIHLGLPSPQTAAMLVIVLAVLLLRPQGLFGRRA